MFLNGKLVIKISNISKWGGGGGEGAGGGGAVGRVSTIGFRSISPKSFEIFE